jgi:hypothetical protein
VLEREHYIDGQHNGGVYNSFNHNTYGYCYQSPVLLVDPNGKQTEFWNTQKPSMAEYIVSATVGFIGDSRAGVMNLASRLLGEESRYRGDGGIGVVKLPEGSTTSIVEDVLDSTVGILTARYGVSAGVLAREVKGGANEGKNIVKDISKLKPGSAAEKTAQKLQKYGKEGNLPIPTTNKSQFKTFEGKVVHKKTGAVYRKSNTTHRGKEGEYKIWPKGTKDFGQTSKTTGRRITTDQNGKIIGH